MNRFTRHQVQGFDINGSVCFHAIRVAPDDWIATRPDGWNLILCGRQHLITYLADLVMERRPVKADEQPARLWNLCMRLESTYRPQLFTPIDMAGNLWIDNQYLAPAQYLPLLVPEEAPDGDSNSS